ncbi:twin-arginine translocase subunit TatC [Colwellia sp. 4_MG-2023]|jgi:sec-independent protein translocase protein TatC|uniref:twin-arginine translocase subunit TatC n=1 Tax=unclassified Colwellia TaxID=196834 RepID=UPI001C084D31|nr:MULTISPECIES: twin-arginine translocase subunit TatC [unclassified Colwellia]MBU2925601.1 twin-arginine translocase subunit TatC [Colwellia sp. C2M11]MDO6487766.1 twin-arginine translocase subunit TatC [Colwellia sp. 6_MG-2023]MDO6506893.1 twin-arginine translocase subunit TatC [Colwellia sp. 5_MG-2023]MDO6555732.1 twin-arginine translocase subunit TatC [Colwellia sp. 4_MG-2023]MDO6652773.1 twin-arginine translocase subunit TatC [Colwellia sp. 3_MG-2023]
MNTATDQEQSTPLESEKSVTIFDHLLELRTRLLHAVLGVIVVFCCLVYFAQDIYQYLAQPLLQTMPSGSQMIATDVASPFLAPFKLTIVLSIFLAMPYILYQMWSFIAPGLYRNEKRLIAPLMLGSTLLFYSGIAFAYFAVFPVIFAFFTSVAPDGVVIATDISSYLDFVLKLFFAFGAAFEIPVAIILMCWTGVTSPNSLRKKRPYVVVGAFVIGMLLTPPDIISQSMLAIPMLLLFEVGIIIASLYHKEDEDLDKDDS